MRSPLRQYIVNPNQDKCHDCPTGAVCDSRQLAGLVAGSVWKPEGSFMRLQQCPPGFVAVRDPATEATDACVACPPSTYSVVAARVGDGELVSASTVLAASGSLCNGAPPACTLDRAAPSSDGTPALCFMVC